MWWIHVAFIGLLVGTESFFTWLVFRNVRHGERTLSAEAEWASDRLGIGDPERVSRYHRLSSGTAVLRGWVGLGSVFIILYTGLFAEVVSLAESFGTSTIVEGTAFFVGIAVVTQLASTPFDLFDTFVVEDIFGFNRQTIRGWLRDLGVGLGIGVGLTAIISAIVLAIITQFPDVWWVGVWALYLAFSLIMLVVYPRVIAPLFNDFEPIEAGELRTAIEEVFERAGFACDQIYEMDASRRSSKANAYFIGFGRTKRVVLFDTLIEQMEIPEIQSVLAHELAHWKRGHIWRRLLSSSLRMGVLLAMLWLLLEQAWLYSMFGLTGEPVYAGLLLAGLWLMPLAQLTSPIENRLSIRHEREADDFAVEVMGNPEPMAGALATLVSENLSNPFPDPLYELFHYTHPPVPERIRRIMREPTD